MNWLDWLAIASGVLLFGPRLFRLTVGYSCPACQRGRLRRTGSVHDFGLGLRTSWDCRRCGARFSQRNWRSLERSTS